MPAPTVSPTDESEELGPRSPDTAALFGARLPGLFEARRRLPTSATTIDVRATKPELSHPRREGGLDLHPFLSRHALSLAEAVARGEPRSVRSRWPQCWFLPLARVCPAVMPPRAPHHRGLLPRCIVRIDVHGSKDRAKDASPTDSRRSLRRVHTHYWRVCRRTVPLLGDLRTSGVIGALANGGGTATHSRTDRGLRSDDAPRRTPPSRRPGCLPPSRHAKEIDTRRDCSLRPSRRLSRSRRPHVIPSWGKCS